MSGKLKRKKPKLAKALGMKSGDTFEGDRVYLRVESNNVMKARGMKDAIDMFKQKYSRHGKILAGMIEEERQERETHLYFAMYEGCRLTQEDYMSVMRNLKFTEAEAGNLYPHLMTISRKMAKKREETERSIMIG